VLNDQESQHKHGDSSGGIKRPLFKSLRQCQSESFPFAIVQIGMLRGVNFCPARAEFISLNKDSQRTGHGRAYSFPHPEVATNGSGPKWPAR
jgi:hypothetical protein